MELSGAQKHLILGLRIFGVGKDAIVGIVSILDTPQKLDDMMEWMCDNEGASTPEILRKEAEIAKSKA